MAELPDLGSHCTYKECNQLDFLPILCNGCKQIFCTLHSTYGSHNCAHDKEQKVLSKYTGTKSFKCDLEHCKQTELTPVVCEWCRKNFCLQHRHQIDHKCVAYEPPKESMVNTKEHVKNITECKKTDLSLTKKTKVKSQKAKATAAKVALMKMKMSAVGDKGLPDTERVYVKLILPHTCKEKCKNVFFSNKWSIGKTVDYIAGICKLDNKNNVAFSKKLKLFEVDRGEGFNFSEIIEDCILQGSFFSGSTLILEYVNSDVGILEHLEQYSI